MDKDKDSPAYKVCLLCLKEQRKQIDQCLEEMDSYLQYLFRISNMFINGNSEEAMYHLGRLTSELKAFVQYNRPEEKDNGHS